MPGTEVQQAPDLFVLLPVGWVDVEVEPVLDGLALGHLRECQRRWHWAKTVPAFGHHRGTNCDNAVVFALHLVVKDRAPEPGETAGIGTVDRKLGELTGHVGTSQSAGTLGRGLPRIVGRVRDDAIYRDHAERYARLSEHSPPNAHYDRPAILRLVGDIRGKRVLELGCAAGVLTAQLADRGADVLALDKEPRLVAFARERLRDRARIEVADLEQPLDLVPAGSVDVVVASLVLHYIEDWMPLLAELRRCLVPGGLLVFSVHHPITGWELSDKTDYHRVELVSEQWDWDGQPVTGRMYRRPLSAIFGALRQAGFWIDVVDEPRPQAGVRDADPRITKILATMPVFLYVRAGPTR